MLSKSRPSARWRTGAAVAAPVLLVLSNPVAARGGDPGDPVTVTLNATADTGLLELSPEFDYNFGNQRHVAAGTLGPTVGEPRSRMLLRFSIAEQIPAGATITGATARLTVVREPAGPQDSAFHLHRLHRSWTEGTGTGDNPGGRPALPGETTWNQLHHGDPDQNWAAPGGLAGTDFTTAPSATSPVVSSLTRYSFAFSTAGLAEIQEMLDQPCTDHGWILITDRPDAAKSARRWATRENREPDAVPTLTLTYLPPPAATTVTSLELDPSGTTATLTYLATSGVSYRLEASTDLRSPCWNILSTTPTPAPTDGTQSFTVPTNNANRLFYRILAFCPLPQD